METKQIIQASANVVRITNLKKGDVYKRIEDSSYSTSVKFGVVVNLYNDGTKTFVEAIEYVSSYDEISAERKVFSGTAEVNIFPADISEVEEHFGKALSGIEKKIETKRQEIHKLNEALERGREFVSGEMSAKLTTPEFREMSQRDFLVEKREAELAALNN